MLPWGIKHRGYYMAVRRYEISLTRREISYLQATMKCSIYYINTNEVPGELYYAAKGAIYYVTIATVIFSRVKISCFRVKAVVAWYFIGVYILTKSVPQLDVVTVVLTLSLSFLLLQYNVQFFKNIDLSNFLFSVLAFTFVTFLLIVFFFWESIIQELLKANA